MDDPLPPMDLMTPALIGAYAVAGIFIGRTIRNTTSPIDVGQLALVAGTSAVAAALAPVAVKYVMCPSSPTAPLVEAGISTALSWQMLSVAVSSKDATMFAPVQLGAHLAGVWMSGKIKAWKEKKAEEAEAAGVPGQY